MRPSITTLITQGLGYCCPWAFFSIFRQTPIIAARLGVSERSVRRAKAQVDDGEVCCEECAHCMKEHIKTVRLMGKRELGLAPPVAPPR